MARDSMTSSTYMQRPYHGVLVCSVVVCLLLVSTGITAVTWYTVTSRHDNESQSINVTDGRMVPLVTGYDLQEVMQALWDNDVSRIPETDYVLNLQSRTNLSNKIDMADSSLFSNMRAYPQTLSTTYQTFAPLVDNYVATVRQIDTPTMQQRHEIDRFLNAVVDTSVMREGTRLPALQRSRGRESGVVQGPAVSSMVRALPSVAPLQHDRQQWLRARVCRRGKTSEGDRLSQLATLLSRRDRLDCRLQGLHSHPGAAPPSGAIHVARSTEAPRLVLRWNQPRVRHGGLHSVSAHQAQQALSV
ncbi:hypothetical protein NP493_301g02000 [Ridgeia piscesae]|uniref:Uridylate-specific endoribonuclease n=1 Tax=Ridgeia piscesae TaxID=27915 RepID=A0AAD9L6L2_RIDPI|nr:hypothetical protein NP493_301g02000 [Ridgeia piscesae]